MQEFEPDLVVMAPAKAGVPTLRIGVGAPFKLELDMGGFKPLSLTCYLNSVITDQSYSGEVTYKLHLDCIPGR